MKNQCDGCMSGLAVQDGLHIGRQGLPVMACQKSKYEMYALATNRKSESGSILYKVGNLEELEAYINDWIVYEVALENHWFKPVEFVNNCWRLK